jgi:hypothetical protein
MENNETPRVEAQPPVIMADGRQAGSGLEQESTVALERSEPYVSPPAQQLHKRRSNLILVIVGLLAFLGLIGGLVYAYVVIPSAASPAATTAPSESATKTEAVTPTSAVDKQVTNEMTSDAATADTQSDNETKSVTSVDDDTSDISGAYNEDSF